MPPNSGNNIPNNSRIYNYIQQAYEYVERISDDSVAGDRNEFIKNLYRSRLQSVLNQSDPTPGNYGDSLAEWAKNVRVQHGNIIHGRINDLIVEQIDDNQFANNAGRFSREFQYDIPDIESLGVEAYATYLPIHFFFSGEQFDTDWGIYISEKGVAHLAGQLLSYSREHLDIEPTQEHLFVEMAYQILLRHELEHFKIEAFTLNAEMMLAKPLYSPYLINVYTEAYKNGDCLEEALANATVLHSRKIKKLFEQEIYPTVRDRVDLPKSVWQEIIKEAFFKYQPESYTNYYLDKGPHNPEYEPGSSHRRLAMNYLCNQIISGQIRPKDIVPLYAFPPDNYFLRAENLVPIHIVKSSYEYDSFIHIVPPSRKPWERTLKRHGYHFIPGRGKGSHEIWRGPSGETITLNYKKGQLSRRSFNSSLKTLGISESRFHEEKRRRK